MTSNEYRPGASHRFLLTNWAMVNWTIEVVHFRVNSGEWAAPEHEEGELSQSAAVEGWSRTDTDRQYSRQKHIRIDELRSFRVF